MTDPRALNAAAAEASASPIPDPPIPDPDDYVRSPCVRICELDPAGRHCIGCLRTVEEITGWRTMTPAQKRALVAALPDRQTAGRIQPRPRLR